jgi:hypothetical protein
MSEYASSFRVGNRLCQIYATVSGNAPNGVLSSVVVVWSPDKPSSLSTSEQAQYVNGRGSFLSSLSAQLQPLSIRVDS